MPSRFRRSSAIAAVTVSLVAGFEGLRTVAYPDVGMIPTICFGETRGVKMGDTATPEQCKQMLGNSLDEFSKAVDRCVVGNVPDAAYAAFLSLSYNIGPAAFCMSTVARRANAGDMAGACEAITMWDKVTVGGVRVKLPGLARRRAEEKKLCLEGLL